MIIADVAVPSEEGIARTPAPPELAVRAQAAVRENNHCFWFWRDDIQVDTIEQIRLVIHYLRMYGGWKQWDLAQDFHRCLSRLSSATSSA